jgi:hypothetical protein
MLKKIILATAATAGVLGVSTAALAHDRSDEMRGRGWASGHDRHHSRFYAPRPVVIVPAPRVVYAPPPRVAYPYYAAPAYRPVPVHPAPVYSAPSLSIRFDIPL